MSTFLEKSLNERQKIYDSVIKGYSDKIPVIFIKSDKNNKYVMQKHKLLISKTSQLSQLINTVRSMFYKCTPQVAIILIFENRIYAPNTLLTQIYENHKSQDGFLYCNYSAEPTYGA